MNFSHGRPIEAIESWLLHSNSTACPLKIEKGLSMLEMTTGRGFFQGIFDGETKNYSKRMSI